MIIERFDRESDRFHDSSAAESGYYESCDRMGNIQRFPLLSLSIGVVATSLRKFNSYGHLVSVASEVKKKGKKLAREQLLRRQTSAVKWAGFAERNSRSRPFTAAVDRIPEFL